MVLDLASNVNKSNNISKIGQFKGLLLKPKAIYKNYHETEEKFFHIICDKISKRRFDVKVRELYEEANVTKSTFYAHFHNTTEARDSLETKLETDFSYLIPISASSSYVLEVLTIYIVKNKYYFLAVHHSNDQYLLTKILKRYRYNLVDKTVQDHAFYLYILNLQTIINYWLEFDSPTKASALETAEQLKRVRVR